MVYHGQPHTSLAALCALRAASRDHLDFSFTSTSSTHLFMLLLLINVLLVTATEAGGRPVLASLESRSSPPHEAYRGLVLRIAESVVFADYICVGAMRSTLCAVALEPGPAVRLVRFGETSHSS
jgi:hypothetical protein